MATLTLTLDKPSYSKGDKITATYGLTGDDVPTTTSDVPVQGSATVDGQELTFSGTVKIVSPSMHAHTFKPPVVNGQTFIATTNPLVWIGVA